MTFPSARRLQDSRRLEAAIGFSGPPDPGQVSEVTASSPDPGQVSEVTAQPLPKIT